MYRSKIRLNLLLRTVLASLLALLGSVVSAEVINISGVGLSAPLMQRLADAYRKQQPGDTVTILLPPLGSTGALRALRNGRLDIAISGRQPSPDETAGVGKTIELARTAFGFATSSGVRNAGITAKDLADIYAGRLLRWDDDQPIRLIMRPERESDTILVRRISTEVDEAMTLAAKRKGLVVAENDLDTIKLLETVPGSFGPTTTGLATMQGSQVKFIAINGTLPSAKALAGGKYPLFKPLYAVMAAHPSQAAERFFAFTQSPAAREIMSAADFVPTIP
jgi:phosphate transport system substrate-binding protein